MVNARNPKPAIKIDADANIADTPKVISVPDNSPKPTLTPSASLAATKRTVKLPASANNDAPTATKLSVESKAIGAAIAIKPTPKITNWAAPRRLPNLLRIAPTAARAARVATIAPVAAKIDCHGCCATMLKDCPIDHIDADIVPNAPNAAVLGSIFLITFNTNTIAPIVNRTAPNATAICGQGIAPTEVKVFPMLYRSVP